jgi:Flp pilus assembly protein TadD
MKSFEYMWLKVQAIGQLVFGRQAAALGVFNRMLMLWPNDAYALSSRAHLLVEAQRISEALVDSQTLVRLPSATGRTWFNHGFMLESNGQMEDARAAFARATELSPELDRAWYGLGLVLIRLHRFDEAVAALKRNTELQPMSPYGWYQLARVHVDRKEPDKAVKIIRHLKGFEPKVAAQLERETGLLVEGQAP